MRTALGFLAQRVEDDAIEVAANSPKQPAPVRDAPRRVRGRRPASALGGRSLEVNRRDLARRGDRDGTGSCGCDDLPLPVTSQGLNPVSSS
jgi:hypothetical protein